jgi:hypothetical protein
MEPVGLPSLDVMSSEAMREDRQAVNEYRPGPQTWFDVFDWGFDSLILPLGVDLKPSETALQTPAPKKMPST